jgi:hypothetical protein
MNLRWLIKLIKETQTGTVTLDYKIVFDDKVSSRVYEVSNFRYDHPNKTVILS